MSQWQVVPSIALRCRDCRFCRPCWLWLLLPSNVFFAVSAWRGFWESATCRHPNSRYERRPDPVTGRQPKPRQMDCGSARCDGRDQCGRDAQYFQRRRAPELLRWSAACVTLAGVTGYIWFMVSGLDAAVTFFMKTG